MALGAHLRHRLRGMALLVPLELLPHERANSRGQLREVRVFRTLDLQGHHLVVPGVLVWGNHRLPRLVRGHHAEIQTQSAGSIQGEFGPGPVSLDPTVGPWCGPPERLFKLRELVGEVGIGDASAVVALKLDLVMAEIIILAERPEMRELRL